MLTEIALTPHTFQPCTINAQGWASHLRALLQRLEHYSGLCPVVFSNLNDGHPTESWLEVITSNFTAYKPSEHRVARDLFDKIKKHHLVVRPLQHQVQAASKEDQWVKEAILPAPKHPIAQIVISFQGANSCRKVYARVLGLNDLDGAGFWNDLTPSAFPQMTIDDQVQVLRPIWLHGQVLAVVLPYGLDTGRSGEANWFFEFASRAFSRPPGHKVPTIQLHVSYEGNGNDLKTQGIAHPVINNFIQFAKQQTDLRSYEFSLFVRARSNGSQRFIARRVFAGDQANVGTETPNVRIRWGIALEHVAHLNDSPNQTPPTFTLLPRQQADDQFRFECQNSSPRLLGPVTVRC